MGLESDFEELVWENGQLLARGRSKQSSDSLNIQKQCEEEIFKDKKSSFLQETLSVLYQDFEHNGGSSHETISLQRVPDQAPEGDGDVPCLTSFKHQQISVPTTKANRTPISSNQCEKQERTNFSLLFKTFSSGMSRPTSGLSASEGFKGEEDNEHVTGRGSCKLGSKEADSALEERQVRFPVSLLDSADNGLGPSPRNNPPKQLLPDDQYEPEDYKAACKLKGCSDVLLDPSSSLVQYASQRTTTSGNNVEQLAAASSCGASNDLTYTLKRIREESDSYTSEEDIPEEEHNCVSNQLRKGRKGSRVQEVHSLPGKRRRAKINKKMRALQELIPKCSKMDNASLLDDAINYLKTLQLQVQMMAMGTPMFHPGMMLPAPAQHLNAQHLANYSALANFMPGMRMQMFGGFTPLQVPHSLLSGTSSPAGVPKAQPDIACFPSQALPISGAHSPFLFSPQMASPQYVQPAQNTLASASGQIQLPNSAPLPSGKQPKRRDIIGEDK